MKKIISLLILLAFTSCTSVGKFGAGVDITFDPRTIGMQIDDTIMQKNLSARLVLADKKYLFSVKVNLATKFFCINVSSIIIPTVLGSNLILTPLPKVVKLLFAQLNRKKGKNVRLIIFFIIFYF